MTKYIKKINAEGIFGRFDLNANFLPGINIVHGRNGTGKTTLIHILANALNGEFLRFAFLDFQSIRIELDDKIVVLQKRALKKGDEIQVKIDNKLEYKFPVEPAIDFEKYSDESYLRRRAKYEQLSLFDESDIPAQQLKKFLEESTGLKEFAPLLSASYFPAFRTMIDAWASVRGERETRVPQREWTNLATKSARRWFGSFVPIVNYPSLIEIEQRLSEEINDARIRIGRADRELLSQAFLQIFSALSEKSKKETSSPGDILFAIRRLFDRLEKSPLQEESTLVTKVYAELRDSIHEPDWAEESEETAIRVLDVYRKILEEIVDVQEESFLDIQKYLESVNEFLEGKALIVAPTISRYRWGLVGIGFDDGTSVKGLRVLSSGERQIVTMIYASTHMSEQKVVFIDEPEISLHVDWQRKLLKKMSTQLGERQIIACTHSPVIGADYEENQVELVLIPTKRPSSKAELDIEEEMV